MYRTTLFAATAAVLLAACTNNGGTTVDVTIEGAAGRTAMLERFERGQAFVLDSVTLDANGHGKLRAASLPLDFYRVHLGNEQAVVLAMDSTESPVVVANLESLNVPASISGSAHTEALYAFQASVDAYEAKRQELREKMTATPEQGTALMDELNALNASFYAECKSMVEKNSGSPVAITALSKLNIQRDFELFKQVRNALRQTMPNSTFFAQFRENVDRMEQQELAMKLQEEEEKRLANMLPIGGMAPDIRQQTPDGGTYALSDMRGKYVLIDFWASWCKPCRIENPAVKRVYDKYSKKGFEILGVSLDRSQEAWVQAIQADGLPWKHVSDLGFWNNAAAQEYGVSSIPFTVLVDKEGKIIAKGLRSQQLEAELAKIFGS
ncbi:MAG: TlpA disulfide reductase family protein [Flavobacteriales bacterium]